MSGAGVESPEAKIIHVLSHRLPWRARKRRHRPCVLSLLSEIRLGTNSVLALKRVSGIEVNAMRWKGRYKLSGGDRVERMGGHSGGRWLD